MSISRKVKRNRQKKDRQRVLKPFDIPTGMQPDDLYAVGPDGTVIPLSPEVLGDDWESIRAFFSGIDRSTLPSLGDFGPIQMEDEDAVNRFCKEHGYSYRRIDA